MIHHHPTLLKYAPDEETSLLVNPSAVNEHSCIIGGHLPNRR